MRAVAYGTPNFRAFSVAFLADNFDQAAHIMKIYQAGVEAAGPFKLIIEGIFAERKRRERGGNYYYNLNDIELHIKLRQLQFAEGDNDERGERDPTSETSDSEEGDGENL